MALYFAREMNTIVCMWKRSLMVITLSFGLIWAPNLFSQGRLGAGTPRGPGFGGTPVGPGFNGSPIGPGFNGTATGPGFQPGRPGIGFQGTPRGPGFSPVGNPIGFQDVPNDFEVEDTRDYRRRRAQPSF
jgi:hypothetical protein